MAVTWKTSGVGDETIWNIEQTGSPVDWPSLPIDSGSTATQITSTTTFEDNELGSANLKVVLTGQFSLGSKSTLGQLSGSDTISGAKLYLNGSLVEEYSFSIPINPGVFFASWDSDANQAKLLAGDDVFIGGANDSGDNDGVRGYAGNDRFVGNGSSLTNPQTFDGGAGTDTAVFSGKKSEYNINFGNYQIYGDDASVIYTGPGIQVNSNTARVDKTKLFNVERLEFADGTWAVVGGKSLNAVLTGSVTITGTAKQSQELKASYKLADADGLSTISYQWLADGKAISNATKSNFKLTQAEVGKVISVKVSYKDKLGFTESKTSAATSMVESTSKTGTTGNDVLGGSTGNDSLSGDAGNDVIYGGLGSDTLVGGKGADQLTGGKGKDTFKFAAGDSGQATSFDKITYYAKGVFGTGDLIDYSAFLSKGGVATTAVADRASINSKTGIATFASQSGTTMADALADVAKSLSLDGLKGAAKDVAGEFAFFKVNNQGAYHLFISDGKAGVTVNDVVVQLVGVTSISGVDLTGGNLTITS